MLYRGSSGNQEFPLESEKQLSSEEINLNKLKVKMLEFGMALLMVYRDRSCERGTAVLAQLLRHSPVILPCGVEFVSQPVSNPRKCLYSLHHTEHL